MPMQGFMPISNPNMPYGMNMQGFGMLPQPFMQPMYQQPAMGSVPPPQSMMASIASVPQHAMWTNAPVTKPGLLYPKPNSGVGEADDLPVELQIS